MEKFKLTNNQYPAETYADKLRLADRYLLTQKGEELISKIEKEYQNNLKDTSWLSENERARFTNDKGEIDYHKIALHEAHQATTTEIADNNENILREIQKQDDKLAIDFDSKEFKEFEKNGIDYYNSTKGDCGVVELAQIKLDYVETKKEEHEIAAKTGKTKELNEVRISGIPVIKVSKTEFEKIKKTFAELKSNKSKEKDIEK